MTYETETVDALISTRAERVREVEQIDEELERRGVRVTAAPIGRTRDVALLVIQALANGPLSSRSIAEVTGQGAHAADQMLSKMTLAGELRRVGRGLYALPKKAGKGGGK